MKSHNYRAYNLNNFLKIPQIKRLSREEIKHIEVVGTVLPFKTNNYVIDELIDWNNYNDDPLFHLTFPQKDMLKVEDYNKMKNALDNLTNPEAINAVSNEIRLSLNPHPAGQAKNVPMLGNIELPGVQHKYRETVLFFPSPGQTCHAYCTFCFRWPQFVKIDDLKFAAKETNLLVRYLKQHQEVTDLLFTGGDPMVMSYPVFERYINPLLDNIAKTNIQTIRIGTKSLSFWPYKFTSDKDANSFLDLFESITKRGINLAIMAHFSHPRELETEVVQKAIRRIRNTGAQIRTQSPVFRHINDSPEIWAEMWRKQVNLNLIPYYMFMARDTGAKEYFEIPIVEAWNIFKEAYSKVSGICRTVRGPSMSCSPGKVMISGIAEIRGEKVLSLRFIQGRNPDWVARPFFAKYDENASWMSDLKPAFGEDKFFFEDEMEQKYHQKYYEDDENKFE